MPGLPERLEDLTVEPYDLAVIGGGSAGLAAARAGAELGRRVLLIEGGRTPSGATATTALVEAARLRRTVAGASAMGVVADGARLDFAAVMAYVRDSCDRISQFSGPVAAVAAGAEVVHGRARLVGPTTIVVDGDVIVARRIVVATGSTTLTPPIDGLTSLPHLTGDTLHELETQPEELIVIGSGGVAVTLAQAFAMLGSAVRVVDVAPHLLPGEDPDVVLAAEQALRRDGVELLLGCKVDRVAQTRGRVRLTLSRDGGPVRVSGDRLLIVAGRRPRIDGLGLEAIGVRIDRGAVAVDEHCRTSLPQVYAAGDVTGGPGHAHVAAHQGRVAARHALGRRVRADGRSVPVVIHSDPEIARAGLTEPQARERHTDIRMVRLPYSAVDRAVIQRRPDGIVKLIARARPLLGFSGGGELVGAHIVGPGAGELIHELALLMHVGGPVERLASVPHAHPTLSAALHAAVERLTAPPPRPRPHAPAPPPPPPAPPPPAGEVVAAEAGEAPPSKSRRARADTPKRGPAADRPAARRPRRKAPKPPADDEGAAV